MEKENYNTVSEALQDLKKRGYNRDFNIQAGRECLICHQSGSILAPEEFGIDEVHRFEGMTDPGDEMILYAISSKHLQVKGVLLCAYGVYGDTSAAAIVNRLILNNTVQ